MLVYNITPVPAPRQVRSDVWSPRPMVVRYRQFRDAVKAAGIKIPVNGSRLMFVLPMPDSWSRKKKEAHNGKPHTQKPDVDNLAKALLDSVYIEDAHVWDIRITKIWGYDGQIQITEKEGDDNE